MRVGTKMRQRSCQTKVFQEVGNLDTMNEVTIEEHQAEKLGVQQLHYLYSELKATTTYGSGNHPLA